MITCNVVRNRPIGFVRTLFTVVYLALVCVDIVYTLARGFNSLLRHTSLTSYLINVTRLRNRLHQPGCNNTTSTLAHYYCCYLHT